MAGPLARPRLSPVVASTIAGTNLEGRPDVDEEDVGAAEDVVAEEWRIGVDPIGVGDTSDSEATPPRLEQGSAARHEELRHAIGELASRLARRGWPTGAESVESCVTPSWFPEQGPTAAGVLFGALVAGGVTAAGLAAEGSLSVETRTALEVVSIVFGGAAGAAITIGVQALREFGFDCR